MKNIFAKHFLFLALFLSAISGFAQLGCLTPSLGVYNGSFGSPVSATIACNNPNLIIISPTQWVVGNNGTAPCMQIRFASNVNSTTNNSLTLFEGTAQTNSLCFSGCNGQIPSSSNYTYSVFFLDPAQSHSYKLCNTLIAPNMNYTISSCYNTTPLATGVWNNASANNCQTVTIPANSAIGQVGYTVSPAVVSTASYNPNTGDLFLDTYQMSQGTYTITYSFNSQNGCSIAVSRTISITNPYTASFSAIPSQCLNGSCVALSTYTSGNSTTNMAYYGTGVSSGSFCPSTAGLGTHFVSYSVGLTPQCGRTATANIVVNDVPVANAGSTKSLTCAQTTTVLTGSSSIGGSSYSWSGPGTITNTNSQNPTVNTPGTFSLVVTSNGCASSIATVAVSQNTGVTNVPATSGSVICTTNTVNLSTTSNGSYNYTWVAPAGSSISSGQGSANAIGAGPGNYSVTVLNTINGCSSTSVIAANVNTVQGAPNVSSTGVITCTNNSVNLNSTTTGVTYTWTAPGGSSVTNANNASATGNGSGTYTLLVTNTTNGCINSNTVSATTSTTQAQPNVSTTGVVTCTNSSINLNSTTTGVTFTWSAPAGSSVGSPNTAASAASGAGVYTLAVTNTTNGCTNSNTVAATTNTTPPSASISNTPVLVCSPSSVTINGGPGAGVTYTWTGPGIIGSANGANVNVNATGNYSLNVTSNTNGCISPAAVVTITNNLTTPTLSATAPTATLGCGSNSVVTLTVTANPGSTSNFTWTSSGGFSGATNASTVSVTGGTTYTVTAFHPTTGCPSSLVYTVNPSSGSPSLTLSSSTATITCNNTTQSTTVNLTSGGNVSYSWTGPGIVGSSTSSVLTVNAGGTYNLNVTDLNNNCSNSNSSFVVTADNTPVTVNGSASSTTVNCSTPSGTISTNPSPAGTFTYNWSTGTTGSSIVINPTVTTTYSVLVTNTSNGCTGSQSFTINADLNPPTAVNVTPNTLTLTCASPTTILTANASGAASYTWITSGGTFLSPTGQSTVAIQGGGSYSVIAIGSNSCSSAAVVATITPDQNAPVLTLSNTTPSVTCNGNPSVNGTTVSVSNLSGNTFSWSPAAGVSSPTSNAVTFTQAGSYSCVVTATNGCSSSTNITVFTATSSPNPVAGTATAQPLSCTNSVVTISPTFNPANDLAYAWSGPSVVGSTTSASAQVDQPGSYTLAVTNTLTGCSSTAIVIPVTGNNTVPTLTVSSTSSVGISCQPNTATVTLDAQSSSSGLNYTWSNGATTQTISTSIPGIYTVTVTDANLCSSTETISVQNNTITPSVSAAASGNLPCGAGSTSLVAVSSNTDVVYSWSGTGIVSGSNSAVAEVNQAGTFTLVATDLVTGCQATETVVITQSTVSALAAANVTTGVSPLNVTFSDAGAGANTYSWTFGNGSTSISQNPATVYSLSGTYTVVLISSNGSCVASDTLIIKVTAGIGVIPEVFTPNGDGKNDVFYIEGLDSYPKASLQVFNRWGSPVFSENPYKNSWDGSANASGAAGSGKLPSATYFYILELNDEDNTVYKGFIQLQY